jgi:hypothetical protein
MMKSIDSCASMVRRRVCQSLAVSVLFASGCATRSDKVTTTDRSERMHEKQGPTPKIARVWRGRTRRERADEYEQYNYEAGIKLLLLKALAVQTFREDREVETEFVTISFWESVEAMAAFTGGDPTRIHHLDRDPEFLVELPEAVQILQVRTTYSKPGVTL